MNKTSRSFVGMDVHKETISISVAEDGRSGSVRFIGVIPNTPEAVGKMAKLFSYTLSKERLGKYTCSWAKFNNGPGVMSYFAGDQFGQSSARWCNRAHKARIGTQRSQEGQCLSQLHPWDLPQKSLDTPT